MQAAPPVYDSSPSLSYKEIHKSLLRECLLFNEMFVVFPDDYFSPSACGLYRSCRRRCGVGVDSKCKSFIRIQRVTAKWLGADVTVAREEKLMVVPTSLSPPPLGEITSCELPPFSAAARS